jgi:hypothetical protein
VSQLTVSGPLAVSLSPSGGYLGFGEGCPSNHRVLWFDASFLVALGQRPPDMAPLQPKRLKAKDPRLTDKYHERVKQKMLVRGFKSPRFQAFFKLRATIDWNFTLQQDFNKLLNEDTAIRKAVESKLRHLCMSGIPWSPTIQLLIETIELWDMLVRKKKNVRVSVTWIRRFLRKVPSVCNAFTALLLKPFTAVISPSRHINRRAKRTPSLSARSFREHWPKLSPSRKGQTSRSRPTIFDAAKDSENRAGMLNV